MLNLLYQWFINDTNDFSNTGHTSYRRKKSKYQLMHENVKKQFILQIKNTDNLCFPSSMLTTTAHALKGHRLSEAYDDYSEKIQCLKNTEQCQRAEELARDARVVISPNGCGSTEIQRFQAHSTRNQVVIVVWNFTPFGRGGRLLFVGTNFVQNAFGNRKFPLRILFFENLRHIRPRLNLIVAVVCRGYHISK